MVRGNPLQKRKKLGRSIFSLSLFAFVLFWFISLFFVTPPLPTSSFLPDFFHTFTPAASKVLALVVYLMIGYLLIPLNNHFGLIQIKASLQTSVFFFFVAACPYLHQAQVGMITPLLLLGIFHSLFNSYQLKQVSNRNIFRCFLYLGIFSLALPQLLFFSPILLLTATMLQALTLRGFFASLLGYATPYWFLFAYAYFTQQMDFFNAFIKEITHGYGHYTLMDLPSGVLLMLGFLFLLFLISSIHFIIHRHRNKLKIRMFLTAILFITFFFFVFIAVQPIHIGMLLPSILVGNSILMAHFIAFTKGKWANGFLILATVCLFVIYVYSLWMQSQSF